MEIAIYDAESGVVYGVGIDLAAAFADAQNGGQFKGLEVVGITPTAAARVRADGGDPGARPWVRLPAPAGVNVRRVLDID